MVSILNETLPNDAEGWPRSEHDFCRIPVPSPACGFAFVDDTDLFCASETYTTSSENLSNDFQAALHRWRGGLIATEGSIAAEKSFCYLIDIKWNGSSWEYQKVKDLPGEFSIQNKDSVQTPLVRYKASHANKTLGVYIATD